MLFNLQTLHRQPVMSNCVAQGPNRRSLLGLLWALLAASAPGALAISAAEHTRDPLPQVRQAVESGAAILIDVREQGEWEAGHLQVARLVPLSGLPAAAANGKLGEKLPKDKIVYCHCGSGQRVLKAADLLRMHGYDVRPLKEGYEELVRAGFPKAAGNR